MKTIQEVEAEIRDAVQTARDAGLVLTRGITNDGERCCLLGAFAPEEQTDFVDELLPSFEERWGCTESDLMDLIAGFDGTPYEGSEWSALGARLARELEAEEPC